MKPRWRWGLWLAGGAWPVWGETVHPAYHPPEVLTWSSGLQIVFSLVLVLGLMAVVAWLLKRFQWSTQARGTSPLMRVVASSAVGQRERVVLVEVDNTWVMVGVAPGHVSALHVQPKPESTHAS